MKPNRDRMALILCFVMLAVLVAIAVVAVHAATH